MSAPSKSRRLTELDALRGIAALAVVLFHYTTRFVDVFHPAQLPAFSFSVGQYGVDLFFILSGFVIFMTLEQTHRPADFLVSRFSRLFPAYWASIALTFSITHLIGLPGKLVGFDVAVANLVMLHGLARIPHVDGVYWTLEVELLFYCLMLALYMARLLSSIRAVLIGLLLLRLVYYLFASALGIDLPFTIYRILVLDNIPWFALGISIYLSIRQNASPTRRDIAVPLCSVVILLVTDSLMSALLAVAFSAVVYLATTERLRVLRFAPFVGLGAISYPLYLLHENIGWSVQLSLMSLGIPVDWTIAIAIAISLALATAVSVCIERPAMRYIRNLYRSPKPAKVA